MSEHSLPEHLTTLLEVYLRQNIHIDVSLDPKQLAYRWVGTNQQGRLQPIQVNLFLSLDELKGIDSQKDKIIHNTRQFLAGLPANHVLMTGTRGSGKSSLVRALLREYSDFGLRVIEVSRDNLLALDKIRDAINELPEDNGCRYIIYCDDLAFNGQDENYRTLKSVLDGSLDSEQDKLLVYATSNRRHLLPQMMKDNIDIYNGQTNEINPYETIDETVSLSDRFGLWLSFHPMNQPTYLEIAKQYVEAHHIKWEPNIMDEALKFASERGGRSGRVAYQFSRQYIGKIKLVEHEELKKVEAKALIENEEQNKLTKLLMPHLDKIASHTNDEGKFDDKYVFMVIFGVVVVLSFFIMLIT